MFMVLLLFCVVIGNCCSVIVDEDKFEEIFQLPSFIDKTLLIKEIFSNADNRTTVVLTAPGGFGKTSNLHMVKKFLMDNDNKTLTKIFFQRTEILDDKKFVAKEMGNHSVLYCSFRQENPVVDYKSMLTAFRDILFRTFALHRYLARSKRISGNDKRTLTCYTGVKKHLKLKPHQILVGLYFLTKLLRAHHDREVILLIDDYDSFILDSIFTNNLDHEMVIAFHNSIFSATLDGNKHISKAIFAGVSCISAKSLVQMEKEINCVRFLERNIFAPFFGITEKEMDHLLSKVEFQNLKYVRPRINNWYGGYFSPDFKINVYNTRSVVKLLNSGEFQNYWLNKRATKTVRYLLIEPVVQQLLNDSISNKLIRVELRNDINKINSTHITGLKSFSTNELWDDAYADLFLRLLFDDGYFTFAKEDNKTKSFNRKRREQLLLKAPNEEIRKHFEHIWSCFINDPTELLDRLKEAVRQASFPVTDKVEIDQLVAEAMTESGRLDKLLSKLT